MTTVAADIEPSGDGQFGPRPCSSRSTIRRCYTGSGARLLGCLLVDGPYAFHGQREMPLVSLGVVAVVRPDRSTAFGGTISLSSRGLLVSASARSRNCDGRRLQEQVATAAREALVLPCRSRENSGSVRATR